MTHKDEKRGGGGNRIARICQLLDVKNTGRDRKKCICVIAVIEIVSGEDQSLAENLFVLN